MTATLRCVINARRVAAGDTVNNFRIDRIEADRVIIEREGLRFELRPRPDVITYQ